MPARTLHRSGNRRRGRNRDVRDRKVMPETGCGATKICHRPSRNANFRKTPGSAICRQPSSNYCASDCAISPACRRNSSCAC